MYKNTNALLDLVDDILQRVSPYLRRNPPLDILDLWPSSGIWSSKINHFLQPRRHVLVEPHSTYHSILEPLIQSKPCYKLLAEPIYGKRDWPDFITTHFPEQGPSVQQKPGVLPKNDTLLILANLPAPTSNKDHCTPGRWWLRFLEDCLQQDGLNVYGTVRVLAMSPYNDLPLMLPRTAADRKRLGSLAETLGLHNIEIASSNEFEHWHTSHGWDAIYNNRKRVAERAAAQNIVTPHNRELPPLERVPELEARGVRGHTKGSPYTPRVCLPQHKDILNTIAAGEAAGKEPMGEVPDPTSREAIKKRGFAITKLARDNTAAYIRQKLANMRLHIDEETRKLARAAADANETPENLKVLDEQIASLQLNFAAEVSKTHYTQSRFYDTLIDDGRLACTSNNLDDSQLMWDRRPFEPLLMNADEIWFSGKPSGIIYFEAQEKPSALQKILHLPSPAQSDALARFHAVIGLTNTRSTLTAGEIGKLAFPALSTNQLVQAVPSLATFASKRIKPGSGPMPLSDPTLDPVTNYQDNIEYDLSEVRLRILSMATIADMVVEYGKVGNQLPAQDLSRLLGGTLTTAQLGQELTRLKRYC